MELWALYLYYSIFYLALTKGQISNNKNKPSIIEEIVRKVTNMTLKSLSQAPSAEKNKLLKNIEDKVNKSASIMGADGHKYFKIIMHGVKLIAFNHTKEVNHSFTTMAHKFHVMRTSNASQKNLINDEQALKEQAIKSIAGKIEKLANKYLKKAKTQEDKQHIIELIKNKVIDTANRRHLVIHSKHEELKSFSNLIAKGVDLMIQRNLKNESNIMNLGPSNIIEKVGNRRKTALTNENIQPTQTNHTLEAQECGFEVAKICDDIKAFNKLTCIYDKKVFTLEKLCDGVIDCFDRSDELNCPEQAVDKIRRVGRIMTKVDGPLLRNCVLSYLNSPLVRKQNHVLRNVLQTQLKFIEKYTSVTSSHMQHPNRDDINKDTLRKTANEVALVVSSLGMALDGSLCARRVGHDNIDDITNSYLTDNDLDKDFDEIIKRQSNVLRSCVCNGSNCSNTSCADTCKRVCWQKYSLDRWSCNVVGGGTSVSLETICDGKLDCYDESDETGCATDASYMKFEANSLYDIILKLLTTKTNSREYNLIINELLKLHDDIKLLQKLSTKRNVEMMNIKIIRDQIFSKIINIYEKYLNKGDERALNDIYDFLTNLNDKLVGAMKCSKTGNDRIIPSAGCYCSGERCGLPDCSKLCVRACSVEPILIRYHCGNVKLNFSVPIESVCNGKSNCPNGDDEEGCEKEVCRHTHLVLLRHKLQDVGNRHKGTGLGEALVSWRTKATSTIMIAEKNDRPKPKILKHIISNILHDLVMAYGSYEEFRRNTNEQTVKEFEILSQQVIESIKTCGK